MERIASQLYIDEPMKRILFKRWVRRMRKVRVQRQRRDLRRSCDRELKQKDTEAAQKIAALQSELEAVQQLLLEHEQQHAEMQEKLRRAFMRGVVNLNLEAMDVFGEVPTMETITVAKAERKERPTDDFFVEPAPRVSVVRHH
jgi:predicted nuclease with TOPRIM domain